VTSGSWSRSVLHVRPPASPPRFGSIRSRFALPYAPTAVDLRGVDCSRVSSVSIASLNAFLQASYRIDADLLHSRRVPPPLGPLPPSLRRTLPEIGPSPCLISICPNPPGAFPPWAALPLFASSPFHLDDLTQPQCRQRICLPQPWPPSWLRSPLAPAAREHPPPRIAAPVISPHPWIISSAPMPPPPAAGFVRTTLGYTRSPAGTAFPAATGTRTCLPAPSSCRPPPSAI